MDKNTTTHAARRLPSIEKLLNEPSLKELACEIQRATIVRAAREVLDKLRGSLTEGQPIQVDLTFEAIASEVRVLAKQLAAPSLRRAINATGVVLHTGLGRAVLSEAARKALETAASGHSTLEVDVESGTRGSRSCHYRSLLAELCGAESALAVNNNAGAVLLALNTLAAGREVIVSRGQLVEIGGSFRMPDIMARAGARLVEVGTTNRTRIEDYEAAISEETALILRVHTSNFRVVGFTEETPLHELVQLGRGNGIPVMEDVGSGAFVDLGPFGLEGEPLVQNSIRAGADVVTFSGDKLLGGPQAGLIVGCRDLVDAMAANPLARALRVDKLIIAALEATLRLHSDPEAAMAHIPTLRFITRPTSDIERACRRLRRRIASRIGNSVRMEIVDGFSEVGGGSLPGQQLPTKLVALSSDELSPLEIARLFRRYEPPIFGRVGDGRFNLDLRTVTDDELREIAAAATQFFSRRTAAKANRSR